VPIVGGPSYGRLGGFPSFATLDAAAGQVAASQSSRPNNSPG
jgi:hypothetical protein